MHRRAKIGSDAAPATPSVLPTQRRDASDHAAELERMLSERTSELQGRSSQLTAARKELEEFSYSVSHDLRAPLRAMHGFARIMMEDHAATLDADAGHCLDRIQAAADLMGQALDGLLVISRLQRRQLSHDHLDVTALVHRAWQQVRPADAAVTLEVDDLPEGVADRELVMQLLVHLLDNAVKFTARTAAPESR